ncbi:hypothetical protein PFISCL1PPCAC_13388, partial [Pristionchus fissidentatus]
NYNIPSLVEAREYGTVSAVTEHVAQSVVIVVSANCFTLNRKPISVRLLRRHRLGHSCTTLGCCLAANEREEGEPLATRGKSMNGGRRERGEKGEER